MAFCILLLKWVKKNSLVQQSFVLPGYVLDSNFIYYFQVYGCEEPGSLDPLWNCGEMAQNNPGLENHQPCKSGNQIVYAWAKDAPELALPANTGFRMGKDSQIKWVFFFVKYFIARHCSKFKKRIACSLSVLYSPRLILTRSPQISGLNKSEAREPEGLVKTTYGIVASSLFKRAGNSN